jgi:hypothetical protein
MVYSVKKIFIIAILILFVCSSCGPFKRYNDSLSASTFYGFDAVNDLELWKHSTSSNVVLSLSTEEVKAGAESIKCVCTPLSKNTSTTVLYQYFSTYANLTNRTVTIWVYVPAGLAAKSPGYYIDLWVQRPDVSSSPECHYGPALNTAGWNEVKFVFKAYSTDPLDGTTHDYQDVQVMYFAVENLVNGETPGDWSGTIYLDELSW